MNKRTFTFIQGQTSHTCQVEDPCDHGFSWWEGEGDVLEERGESHESLSESVEGYNRFVKVLLLGGYKEVVLASPGWSYRQRLLESRGELDGDTKTGVWWYWRTDGTAWKREVYEEGEVVQLQTFHENGQVELEGEQLVRLESGGCARRGVWNHFDEDGVLMSRRVHGDEVTEITNYCPWEGRVLDRGSQLLGFGDYVYHGDLVRFAEDGTEHTETYRYGARLVKDSVPDPVVCQALDRGDDAELFFRSFRAVRISALVEAARRFSDDALENPRNLFHVAGLMHAAHVPHVVDVFQSVDASKGLEVVDDVLREEAPSWVADRCALGVVLALSVWSPDLLANKYQNLLLQVCRQNSTVNSVVQALRGVLCTLPEADREAILLSEGDFLWAYAVVSSAEGVVERGLQDLASKTALTAREERLVHECVQVWGAVASSSAHALLKASGGEVHAQRVFLVQALIAGANPRFAPLLLRMADDRSLAVQTMVARAFAAIVARKTDELDKARASVRTGARVCAQRADWLLGEGAEVPDFVASALAQERLSVEELAGELADVDRMERARYLRERVYRDSGVALTFFELALERAERYSPPLLSIKDLWSVFEPVKEDRYASWCCAKLVHASSRINRGAEEIPSYFAERLGEVFVEDLSNLMAAVPSANQEDFFVAILRAYHEPGWRMLVEGLGHSSKVVRDKCVDGLLQLKREPASAVALKLKGRASQVIAAATVLEGRPSREAVSLIEEALEEALGSSVKEALKAALRTCKTVVRFSPRWEEVAGAAVRTP